MADFCWECSNELGFSDGPKNDLSGLLTEEDSKKGYVSGVVICEGCGFIQVDHLGHCVSEDCIGTHRKHKNARKRNSREKHRHI